MITLCLLEVIACAPSALDLFPSIVTEWQILLGNVMFSLFISFLSLLFIFGLFIFYIIIIF